MERTTSSSGDSNLDLFDISIDSSQEEEFAILARKTAMNHHRKTDKPKRIVIVGAGMAGLAAAARLAKTGHQVTVFEANEIGGKCHTEKVEGFSFDTGPSLLTLPAVYRDLFLKTGKRLEHIFELKPVNPSFTYIFHDGKKLTFPNLSRQGTIAAIEKELGKDEANAWHQLLKRAEEMWEASRETFIEGELRSPLKLLKRRTLLKDLRTIAPWKSMRSYVTDYKAGPHLTKVMDRYATYTGSDPRKAPAVLLTIAFVEEAFGAWHVPGGLGGLATKLAERVQDLGAKIHTNTEVSEIISTSGRATGVRLKTGEVIEADVVVSNVDAKLLYEKLLPANRQTRKPRASLSKATPSFSGFTLMLGLKGRSELGHHTVFFPENYDSEFDSIFRDSSPAEDPAIYICNPDDDSMRPENSEAWTILVNAPLHQPKNGFDWNKPNFKEDYAEHIITKLEDRGLKIRDRLQVLKIKTPADLEREVNAPGGSIYGTSSNGARSAFLRAKNRSQIKNLYCVGGSAHPGGGLPLVGISAEIVVAAIAEQETIA
jgi:phytoene desaturase